MIIEKVIIKVIMFIIRVLCFIFKDYVNIVLSFESNFLKKKSSCQSVLMGPHRHTRYTRHIC